MASAVAAMLLACACTPRGPLVTPSTPKPGAAATPTAQPTVYRCSRVELSASPATYVEAGTFLTFTARAYGCSPSDFRFIWLQLSTGDWQVARDWGPSPTWTWNTRPFSPTAYSIVADARARYELGNGPDASTSLPVVLASPAAPSGTASGTRTDRCAGVAVTTTPPSPVTAGTIVYLKMTASGCGQPEYRLFLLDLSTGTSVLRRDWGPSPDWGWDTHDTNPGRYAIRVDARQTRPGQAGYELDASNQIEVDVHD